MYRALYRKWRPLTFQDVVGQTPIVTALRNQIATGHVGHAYLFTGVRGTGKTSCAKIFAKAINCMHPNEGDPCCACEACRGIENGSILDVVEMDAASNNGVDNIRDLRDETAYTPSACNYKVYIIDEVHMLSTAAFNALLKTLEEPPQHVVFILATTEIQKVPATILSRCQRYDFTRIQPSDLAARAKYVAAQEGLSLTDGAADLIARLADGAARDTLSILDTCAGASNEIDQDLVRRMTGVTDRSYLFAISRCIATADSVGMLAEIAALRQKSVDLKRLTEELILHYRNLMLCSLPNGNSLLSGVSPEEETQYMAACKEIAQSESVRAIRALGTALEAMSRGGDARIELELALFSLHAPAPAAPTSFANVQPSAPVAAPFASAPVAAPAPFASAPVAPAPTPFVSAPVATAPAAPATQSTIAAPTAPVAPTPQAAPPVPILKETPSYNDAPPPPEDTLIYDDAPPPPENMPIYDDAPPSVADAMIDTSAAPQAPAKEESLLETLKRRKQAAAAPTNTAGQTIGEAGETDALQPFPAWKDVLAQIAARDPMMNGYLKRCRAAYRAGNRILLDIDTTVFGLLKESKTSQALMDKILLEVTGERLTLAPYRTTETPVQKNTAVDSLRALEVLGVPIDYDAPPEHRCPPHNV